MIFNTLDCDLVAIPGPPLIGMRAVIKGWKLEMIFNKVDRPSVEEGGVAVYAF